MSRKTERTVATILFADLVGFTALSEREGPEEAYRVVTPCLRLLEGIARGHGGAVDKYLGDCLMAVFGYPVPAPRGAAAALAAAAEMRECVSDYNRELALALPLGIHIGVNTGSVIAGDIRGPVIREFHVLGDAVNVAARLKERAPLGGIYLGEETHAEARELYAFRALEPLALKGKTTRVASYELLAPATQAAARPREPLRLTPLFGRDAELEALRDALDRLVQGGGGAALLVGEAGSGKSRLLAELADAAEAAGIEWLDAAARGTTEAAVWARALETRAQERPLAVGFDVPERDAAAVAAQLGALLDAASRAPLLVLAAVRPGPGAAALREALARSTSLPALELELGPLPREACERLVDALAADQPLAPKARARIVERAAGHPQRLLLGVFLAPALDSQSERERREGDRTEETERRRSTVLFADITGFTRLTETLGDERAYAVVARALALLDEAARKHGGTVDKYLGDCVMALFGVPRAIEDAPRAAVNAALEMRARIHELSRTADLPVPLDVHCGITTGLGIAGDVSGPLLREFALMGDPVSVASRLKDVAPAGEIWLDAETQRFVRDVFELRPAEAVELKGRRERAPSFALLSKEQRLYRRRLGAEREISSVLVGRDAEIAALREGVAALAAGRGGVVSLVAEAGLGKSRLVTELAAAPEVAAVRLLEGRSLSMGQNLAFHPFADLLRSFARITDADAGEEIPAKLEAALAPLFPGEVDEVLPFVGSVMGVQLPERHLERLEGIPGDALSKLIRHALGELFTRSACERPLLLVFDDLHWADLSSIELLEAMLPFAESHPILFLNVFRPGYADTSERILGCARGQHGARHRELRLEPLDREASRQLVHNLFRNADVPHAVRQLLLERAAGNPFYFEEVVRSLAEEGAIEPFEGGFRATEKIHSAQIPGTVQEVIMARVDRLGLQPRRMLQVASVIGRSFHLEVLAQIFEDPERLRGELAGLVAAQFLVEWDRLQGAEYAFKHPLIQEVTYDSLLAARREELHGQVGRAIEATPAAQVPGYRAMLAYHFSLGRDFERAETYLFEAGNEAARSAASNEALRFFQEASNLYLRLHGEGGDPQKKAVLEKNVALALFNRGELLGSVERFDRALEHLGLRLPKSTPARVARFAADLLVVLWALYRPGRRRARPAATPVDCQVIDLMFRRALSQTTADPKRFVFDSMATLRRLVGVDARTVPEAAGIYAGTIGIFSFGGVSFALGRRFLAVAHEVAQGGQLRELYLYYRLMNFLHHMFEGDWSPRHEIAEEDLEEGMRYGRFWEVATYLDIFGLRHIQRGDFAGAMVYRERLQKLAELYHNELALAASQAHAVNHHLERRELGAALRAIDVYEGEHDETLFKLLALGWRAKAQLLLGDIAAAERSIARASELSRGAGILPPFHRSNPCRSAYFGDLCALEAALRRGDRRGARRLRTRARRSRRAALATAAKAAYQRTEVYRLAGRHAWLLGRRRAALRWWAGSLEAGRSLGMRPELARTCQEIGLRLRGERAGTRRLEGRGAEAWLAEADATFAELGLEWDRARLAAGELP